MTNIQDEVQKIHHQYGMSEVANYKIQLLCEKYAKEYHDSEVKKLNIPAVSNHALWRIEPYFDGISTAVTTYKVVDQNGTLQYMGDRNQCEYFLQHGC